MILIYVAIIIGIIGISITILGKVRKKRKVMLSGIFILLLLIIAIMLFIVYSLESEQEKSETQIGLNENEILKVPDTIIDQNESGEINYTTAQGTILNTYENGIGIGLTDLYWTHNIVIKDTTYIEDYISNKEVNIEDLKVGDCVYVEGIKMEPYNDLEKVEANKILICGKEKVKAEAGKYIKDTYRIDGLEIELKNVDSDGNGYIIATYEYENFIYPIKLNVNSETETYLGMGYHLESNYGYILHEISDITLDTKITDIDNIKGYVKMIEYIAD